MIIIVGLVILIAAVVPAVAGVLTNAGSGQDGTGVPAGVPAPAASRVPAGVPAPAASRANQSQP